MALVGIFVADAEVVAHRVVAAVLDDRRPRQLDSTGENRRQFGRPLRRGRRSRLRGRSGHIVRCFHVASDSAAQLRRTGHTGRLRTTTASMGENRCMSGRRRDHPDAAAPGRRGRTRPDGRASRHGQLPGRRARSPPVATPAADAQLQSVPAAAESRAGHRASQRAAARRLRQWRAGHRHPCRRPAQPRDGFADVLDWCSGPLPPTAPTNPG